MTAFIVQITALPAAIAVAGGPEFTVPLAAEGGPEATHMGCNWVGCPAAIDAALRQIVGVKAGEDFFQLGAELGLSAIIPAEIEAP